MASNRSRRIQENSQDIFDQQSTQSSAPIHSLFVWPQHIAQIKSKQHEQPTELPSSCLDLSNCSMSVDVQTSDSVADLNQEIERASKSSMEDEGEALESGSTPQTTDGKPVASFLIILIQEVRKYPCVWNISIKSYKNRPKKMEAWRRISTSLKVPGETNIK